MYCKICEKERRVLYTLTDKQGDRYNVLACGHKADIEVDRKSSPAIIIKCDGMGAGGINRV